MTAEMLAKSRQTAEALGLAHVRLREGLAEALPVEDAWADVVISNGGSSTCAPTSRRCLLRSSGCCAPEGGSSSPTSPTAVPCQPGRCVTSICGPVE